MNEEEIKTEFEKIWDKIKELEEKQNGNQEISIKPKQEKISNNALQSEIKIFCKNNGLDESRLKYEIDFQEEYPRIINLPKEKVRTKLQFIALMTLGILYRQVYEKPISNNIILKLFGFSRVPIDRMDKLYGSPMFKKFFTKSKDEIKFSWAGEKEAEKMIAGLIKNEANT